MENNKLHDKLVKLQENMLNFAYSLTSDKDRARDLLQETSLRVLDNESKFIDNSNFKGWVLTVMRHIFINNYRRMARSKEMFDNSDNLYQLNKSGDSGHEMPESALNTKEIVRIINTFPDEYRLPISRHIAGYKYAEIAKQLNLPLGTVKSRIFIARSRLQKILKDYI